MGGDESVCDKTDKIEISIKDVIDFKHTTLFLQSSVTLVEGSVMTKSVENEMNTSHGV